MRCQWAIIEWATKTFGAIATNQVERATRMKAAKGIEELPR